MIAVDTNILVRYATNDEPVQAQQAKALLNNAAAIFVSKTALLEFEWVLRSAYKLPRESILHSILTIWSSESDGGRCVASGRGL